MSLRQRLHDLWHGTEPTPEVTAAYRALMRRQGFGDLKGASYAAHIYRLEERITALEAKQKEK